MVCVREKAFNRAQLFHIKAKHFSISLILFTHRINSVECVKMLNEPMTPT